MAWELLWEEQTKEMDKTDYQDFVQTKMMLLSPTSLGNEFKRGQISKYEPIMSDPTATML